MKTNFKRKKIFFSLILLFFLILLLCFYKNIFSSKETPVEVYSLNQSGQMRSEDLISNESFDQYGNLTHYIYKQQQENGSFKEIEYNIHYNFDAQNRITEISCNDDSIEIQYTENGNIAKIISQTNNPIYFKNSLEYTFNYDNSNFDITAIEYYQYDPNDELFTTFLNYKFEAITLDEKEYSLCTISNESHEIIKEILFESKTSKKNFSNVFSLLNIEFYGYTSFSNDIKNYNFSVLYPIFNSGNLMYTKDLSLNSNTDLSIHYYYDNNDRILKSDMAFASNTYDMYEEINDKEYYGYSLENFNNTYAYIKYKDYLDDNNTISKREILIKKDLSENEYEKKLVNFKKYFEENKKDLNINY